ncbi:MAG: molybdopterin molybdotransferase MoeA [Mariniblastus sp.]|nr:molybdopterin molybdotransferase MoeA [Mariniblastus sp.]
MIPIATALEQIRNTVQPWPVVSQDLISSVGMVLARDVLADIDSPPHHKSVMDGYAVRSSDIQAGCRELVVTETIVAGSSPQQSVKAGCAARIMTGAPLPEGADAVVMVEKTSEVAGAKPPQVRIDLSQIAPGHHTMSRAENYRSGDVVLSRGHQIRAADIGLLAEVGCDPVEVYRQPTIAVLPTGDELVKVDQQPGPAQIRNSNGPMLVALNQAQGLAVEALDIGRDDPAQLKRLVEQGLQKDVLLLSGGVSAGMLDLVPKVLAECGVEQVFHKVAVKPGKPIWFGQWSAGTHTCYVFGLPGNPLSSLVGYHLFVRYAIQCMFEQADQQRWSGAQLVNDHQTRGNRPTFWPGKIQVDSGMTRHVATLPWNGSSDLRALGQADCLVHFPLEKNEWQAGEPVEIWPLER